MQLKILLINQQQVKWAKRLNKRLLNRYEKKELVLMTKKVKLSKEDEEVFQKLNIKVGLYKNFGIKQSIRQNLSIIPVNIIKQFLERVSQEKKIKNIITYHNINLLSIMANDIYVYHYWEFLLFIQQLQYLILHNKPLEILVFGHPSLNFFSPERPAINYLFNNEFTYVPLIKEVCQKLDTPLIIISPPLFFLSPLKFKIRHFIFTSVKFLKILNRHFLARLPIYRKEQIKSEDKKRIGIIIRAEAEYYTVKPVLEKIKKGNLKLQPIILQSDMLLRPQSWKTLRRCQEEFVSLYSLTSFGQFLKGFIGGLIRQMKFKWALKQIEFDAYNPARPINEKLSTDVLSRDYIAKEVFKSAAAVWPETIIFIEELKKFIISGQPKALISLGMIDHWVAITTLLSNQYSIPTIAIQPTAIPTHPLPSPIYANKFLVYGKEIKKALIDLGQGPDKIVVTGAPNWDKYIQLKNNVELKFQIKQQMDISEETKILLIALDALGSSDAAEQNNELIDLTLKFLISHQEIYGIFKLHPRDPFKRKDYAPWQKIIKEKSIKAQFVQDVNILDLILISNVFLSRFSVTILSALIIGVPPVALLNLEASTWSSNLDYLRTKATTKVKTKEELFDALGQAFYNDYFYTKFKKEQEFFLKESVGMIDGQATDRVLKIIKSMI